MTTLLCPRFGDSVLGFQEEGSGYCWWEKLPSIHIRSNMNAEAANLLRERKAQVEALGGISAARRHALKHLKLKTVIKVVSLYLSDNWWYLSWINYEGCRNNNNFLLFVGKPLFKHQPTDFQLQ